MSNAPITIERPAVIEYANGDHEFIKVNVPCDPGRNYAPHWQVNISYKGRKFRFLRDGHNVARTPIYKEVQAGMEEDDVEEKVMTEAEHIKMLESYINEQYQHMNVIAQRAKEQELVIISLKKYISELESKVSSARL